MERKLVDVGHQVEPEPGLVSDITHVPSSRGEVGRIVGAGPKGSEALQATLKKAATSVGNGFQERRDKVIAYARREPVAALTAAAGFGCLLGLALALGSRVGSDSRKGWLPKLDSRRSFLGRWTGSRRRGLLRLAS